MYSFSSQAPAMFRRKTAVFNDVKYEKLDDTYDDIHQSNQETEIHSNDGYLDSQFTEPTKEKIPWKAITLAFLLCLGGLIMLTFAVLIIAGHLDTKFNDRMWPMIITGVIMFIPGAYHVRIAIYAYKQYPGYSFDDIPGFD